MAARPGTAQQPLAALVALAPVALYGLYWGNPVLPVYAAMGGWVWALTRGTRRMDLAAGALMSVGLLKPQLALPLAVLAALCLLRGGDAGHRRRYVAYGFASACVFWLALDLLATGPAMLLDWPLSILYLSRITRLYPDMPSLLGLLQPLVLGFSDASYSALSAVIIALTVVAVGVLYWKLRRVTAAPALLALLTVVWCVGAPYAHANDEILLLPGGLALLVALGGARQVWKDWQRAERDRGGRAAERRALAGVVLAVPALGLLYLGGTLHFITIRGHALPWSVAGPVPLVLLVALGVALPALARQGTSTAARDVEQARGLVPSSTATSPAGMA